VQNAFYEPAGPGTFLATDATAGPWSREAQHGGPPAALAARAMERHEPDDGLRLARVSVDILRPVPVTKVALRTRTVRPGRRVALAETIMEADGQQVLHARGWRIAVSAAVPSAAPGPVPDPPPIPATQRPVTFPGGYADGYLSAIEWRFESGGFGSHGPTRVWTRARLPLLAGEEPSPMSRTLLVADSGSGVSAVLDPTRFLFINVDLTVVSVRDPAGEWLMLDAASTIGGTGTGLAQTALSDSRGPFGVALQTLLVAPR
jgi:Thioesterase-like superfamily